MLWVITCYNGKVLTASNSMDLDDAINCFIKDTGLHKTDIKVVHAKDLKPCI